MKAPVYSLGPIGNVGSLSRALGIPLRELHQVAQQADSYYSANKPEEKPSGGFRQHYTVAPPLKKIQDRILDRILRRIVFPPYLYAVKDDDYSRDYIADALIHAGCRTLISVDIADYFSSIKTRSVKGIWQYFFNFPPEVADILTNLSVYSGFLPQGASTSSYIAVLLLHDEENQLEFKLQEKGFTYTRYVDDIYVSAPRVLSDKEKNSVLSAILAMLGHHDLRPSRRKLEIQMPNSRMTVHNLNLNSGRPTKSKEARQNIRAAVRECETMAQVSRSTDDYIKQWGSVRGRVGDMARLHPEQAKKLLARLKAIAPTRPA